MTVTRPVFTRANALTLLRVPLAGLIWLAPSSRSWLLAILVLAAASDVLDGRVARALRRRDRRRGVAGPSTAEAEAVGAWLDPLCDKLFVLSMVGAIAHVYRPPLVDLLLIATREIILLPLILIYLLARPLRRWLHPDFRAGPAGKATTVTQFAAVAAIVLLPRAATGLAIAAAAIGLVASALYLSRAAALTRDAAARDKRAGGHIGAKRMRGS